MSPITLNHRDALGFGLCGPEGLVSGSRFPFPFFFSQNSDQVPRPAASVYMKKTK